MRVAICDDDEKDLNTLGCLLHQYDTSNIMNISTFSSADELYRYSKTTPIDVAVLDIEMDAPNGYEIACQLVTQGNYPVIIFVTNSMAYTIRGYGIAHRYLPKPLSKPLLWEALDTALMKIKANRFIFTIDGGSHITRIEDIYYFEIFNHIAVIHTCDNEFTFRASLKEIAAQLPPGYFGSPHQSYLVNFNHVKSAHTDKVVLTNGVHIPVSRRKLKPFQEDFHLFLGRL